ncbi:hypothetical protein EJ913_00480 [Azospirillum doebereinerae]|uniref:Uncharacterized protein n=1 Tax=Azospirillum doebereinerae TaxID=92933 RepID=A0A433JEN7_9PROT|nr:hypothetical protein EJ913_00480 [Azospirillum doebereinerae]
MQKDASFVMQRIAATLRPSHEQSEWFRGCIENGQKTRDPLNRPPGRWARSPSADAPRRGPGSPAGGGRPRRGRAAPFPFPS